MVGERIRHTVAFTLGHPEGSAEERDFLEAAAMIGVKISVAPYPFSEADRALADLKHERFTGAAVLVDFGS